MSATPLQPKLHIALMMGLSRANEVNKETFLFYSSHSFFLPLMVNKADQIMTITFLHSVEVWPICPLNTGVKYRLGYYEGQYTILFCRTLYSVRILTSPYYRLYLLYFLLLLKGSWTHLNYRQSSVATPTPPPPPSPLRYKAH